MPLAAIRTAQGTRAVRIDGAGAIETGHPDVGALLTDPDWRQVAELAVIGAPARHVDEDGARTAVARGTPGGAGHARKPPRYLQPGQVLTTSIAGPGPTAAPLSRRTRMAMITHDAAR